MTILRSTANPQSRAGDTLVEVLISIAIVSMVVTGAYALANRSLHQGISASEHSQALKLAEGQLESLKFRQQHSAETDFLNTFGAALPTSSSNFCLKTSSTGPTDSINPWLPQPNSQTADLQTLASGPGAPYNPSCVDTISKYFMNINVRSSVSNPPSYLITIRWNAIGGGTNQTQLYYRF